MDAGALVVLPVRKGAPGSAPRSQGRGRCSQSGRSVLGNQVKRMSHFLGMVGIEIGDEAPILEPGNRVSAGLKASLGGNDMVRCLGGGRGKECTSFRRPVEHHRGCLVAKMVTVLSLPKASLASFRPQVRGSGGELAFPTLAEKAPYK